MPNIYFYKPGDPRNPAPKKKVARAKRHAKRRAQKRDRSASSTSRPPAGEQITEPAVPITTEPNPTPKKLGKTKRELTARARLIIQEIVNGADEKSALKAAGYSDNRVENDRNGILRSPVMQHAFRDILDEAGVTDDRIADKIASLMDARETKFFAHQGKIINKQQVDALSIQAEMVQFAAKLRGHVIDRSASLNVTVTLTDRLKSARERLQNKPIDKPVEAKVNDYKNL